MKLYNSDPFYFDGGWVRLTRRGILVVNTARVLWRMVLILSATAMLMFFAAIVAVYLTGVR